MLEDSMQSKISFITGGLVSIGLTLYTTSGRSGFDNDRDFLLYSSYPTTHGLSTEIQIQIPPRTDDSIRWFIDYFIG